MRLLKLLPVLLVSLGLSARGGIIYSPFANGGNVPDGTSAGWSGTATASGFHPSISDVSVNLNISGGYNGDLYAYLSYEGVLVPLLNRVGVGSTHAGSSSFGYSDSGFNITLTSAGNDVHWYQDSLSPGGGQLTGTWQADGRALNPQSAPANFDSSAGRVTFGSYNDLNPNGTWTLFIADLSSGGGQSQLVGWSLDITAVVPEPVNMALGVFAGTFVVIGLWRAAWVRRRFPKDAQLQFRL